MDRRNIDIKHRSYGEVLEIGDMVEKESQINKLRKGGKMDKKREDEIFVMEEFFSNRNVLLRLNFNMIQYQLIASRPADKSMHMHHRHLTKKQKMMDNVERSLTTSTTVKTNTE